MDFIVQSPKCLSYTAMLMVIDRLSKYAHFMPLTHPYTASQVAQTFFDNVIKYHGMPKSTVSDRVSICTSNFWQVVQIIGL